MRAMPDPKLAELTTDGNFRAKVDAVIRELQGNGFKDTRIAEACRTLEQQREKVRKRYSKTMKSKHVCALNPSHQSEAADIVPQSTGWAASRAYWLTLGRCALLHGLTWGGLWGLNILQRARLKKFLTDTSKPFSPDNWGGPMGWDTAHVEKAKP